MLAIKILLDACLQCPPFKLIWLCWRVGEVMVLVVEAPARGSRFLWLMPYPVTILRSPHLTDIHHLLAPTLSLHLHLHSPLFPCSLPSALHLFCLPFPWLLPVVHLSFISLPGHPHFAAGCPEQIYFSFWGHLCIPSRCSSAPPTPTLPSPNHPCQFPSSPVPAHTPIFPPGTHQPASSDSLVQRPPPQFRGSQASRVQIGHLTAASAVNLW